jgi:protein SDA1
MFKDFLFCCARKYSSFKKSIIHHHLFHILFLQKRQRHVERQKKNRAKAQEKHEKKILGQEVTNGLMDSVQKSKRLYPAIELLRDPQGLAELILKRLRVGNNTNYKFQVKLLMINFLTRLVGNHELLLLPLYPYLQRYMGGHQRDVTAVLAYTVQACHSLVPPDEIYGILKTIAHNFITERCSGEQMAVGINAARAICSRCPSVMNTEDDNFIGTQDDNTTMMSTNRVALDMEGFAQDLAGYAKHRDRSAAIAGRAWYV